MPLFLAYILQRPAVLLALFCSVLLLPSLAAVLGALLAGACAGVQLPGSETNLRYAAVVLAAGATLRLFGQVLRVQALRATPPQLEAYALRTLAGLHQYPGAHSPRWRAFNRAGSLALERTWPRLASAALSQWCGHV